MRGGRFAGVHLLDGRFAATRVRADRPFHRAFLSDFTTDLSGRFTGSMPIRYDPAALYTNAIAGTRDYLGATTPGAVYFGEGAPGMRYAQTDFAAKAGLTYEVYMLTGSPQSVNGVSYSGYAPACDLTISFQDGDTVLASEKIANVTAPVITTLTSPPGTNRIRMHWLVKGTNRPRPWCIYTLSVLGFEAAVPRPTVSDHDVTAAGVFVPVGGATTIDYSPVVEGNPKMRVEGDVDATVNGLSLTVSPRTPWMAEKIDVRFERDGLRSFLTKPVRVTSAPSKGTTVRDTWHVCVEAGDGMSLDAISMVRDGWGIEPYTAEVLTKPDWMEEHRNGHVWGRCPAGSPGPDVPVSIRVTDGLGAQTTVTWPVSRVAFDRSAAVTLPAGSEIRAGVDANRNPSGATVIQLEAGSYTVGNTYDWRFDPDKPLILLGAPDFGTVLSRWTSSNATNIRFENIAFAWTSLPNPVQASVDAGQPIALTDLNLPVMELNARQADGQWTGHSFVKGCTFRGFEQPDLTLEADAVWIVRDLGNGSHERQTQGNQTHPLPAAGSRYGVAMYGGGLDISGLCIVMDCHATRTVMAYNVTGQMNGLFDCTSNLVRTDVLRIAGYNDGTVIDGMSLAAYDPVKDICASHWGNMRGDGHKDLIQIFASNLPNSRHGDRVLVRNVLGHTNGEVEVQGWQNNYFTVGAQSITDDERRGAHDWTVEGCALFQSNTQNGTNFATAGDRYIFRRNAILPDPGTHDMTAPMASTCITRLNGLTCGRLIGHAGWSLSNVTGKPWDSDDAIFFRDQGIDILTVMPNLARTDLVWFDPREAVKAGAQASDARFWVDPASPHARHFPAWMSEGAM
ncbi:hypothetical protein [Tropicibacter sp. S64]|uniref:hypothetical protein n=1 Tax=Tropicibacter sp. S64 TaxID=3415122 RepID=UPI003C7CB240